MSNQSRSDTCRHLIWIMVLGITAVSASVQGETPPPTPLADAAEAVEFVREAEEILLHHWTRKERATWVQENFITDDTERIAAEAYRDLMAATAGLAKKAVRYDGLELPFDVARKLKLIKTSQP